jgi:carbonic anhydrase/acetyltransferase-like protein (isoleucine patch superfamily)
MHEKSVLIAGGGGFGCELWTYLKQDIDAGRFGGFSIKGFLDDTSDSELLRRQPNVNYCGTIKDYSPKPNEVVIIAVGSVIGRRNISELLSVRGGRLLTYVHSSALIAPDAYLGEGSVVCPNAIINAGAIVQKNVVINVFCSVGHGANIGADSVLSPYCSLSGNSVLGAGGFMGTRATLFPKVVLGNGCIVDAHTAVRQSALAGKIISTRGPYQVLDNRFTEKNR